MMAFSRWTRSALLLGCALALMAGSCAEEGDPIDPGEDTADLTVRVRQDNVTAMTGVTVRTYALGGSTALATRTTNGSGLATFESLNVGHYEVEAVPPSGFELGSGQSARDTIALPDTGAVVSFNLHQIVLPTDAQIRARVLDGTTGIAGVDVALFAVGGSSALESLETNAGGFAMFSPRPAGDYDVEITLPAGYTLETGETARKEVTAGAGTITDVQFGVNAPATTTVDIFVGGTSFSNADVTITPGTTVRWIWSNGSHTVTPTGHTEWTSMALNSTGDMLVHVFNGTGTFNYHCIPHQSLGMTGVIRVQN